MSFRAIPANGDDFRRFKAQTKVGLCDDARGIAAVDASGQTKGLVIFDRWTHTACQAHVALSTAVAGRVLMESAARYVFVQCGRRMMLGTIAKSNKRSLRLALRLGFQVHHVIPGGFAEGDDLVLLELRRENCRWIENERQVA